LFGKFGDADRAIRGLKERGFSRDDISVLAKKQVMDEYAQGKAGLEEVAESTAVGALTGGMAGGLLGILVSVGAIAIPGLGPAVAAGTLASSLGITAGGAGLGTAVGGILGAMTRLGVSEDEAHVYAEGIQRGGVFLAVETEPERVPEVRQVFDQANVLDAKALQQEWRKAGWVAFDEDNPPAGTLG